MKEQVVPISIASAAISKLTGKPAPNYRTIWQACVDGTLTATRCNGRWYVDVAQVAAEMGLAKAPRAKAAKPAA